MVLNLNRAQHFVTRKSSYKTSSYYCFKPMQNVETLHSYTEINKKHTDFF